MTSKVNKIEVNSALTLSEITRIKLLNRVVLIFTSGVVVKLILELFSKDITGIIITLCITTTFLLTLVFNYFKQVRLAQIYFTFILTVCLSLLNILFGPGFGSEFGFFPLIIMAIIFFKKHIHKALWFIFFIGSYASTSLYLQYNDPILLSNLSNSAFLFMFIVSSFSVFLMSMAFIRENERFEFQTNNLLKSLNKNNKTLEKTNSELENANNELEKFAYVASHDLKTPLRNINSFLMLIQRKIKQGKTEEINEYLEFASLNAKRMHGLIQDILEFSQVNKDKVSFENKDLNQILEQAISNLHDLIHEKKVVIEKQTLPPIFCNASQITSLFQNLLENGIKYNESETPTIKIEYIDSHVEHEIYINDNGIGIEKEYLEKVFEMFYRLHNQGEYSGTGIGLASCRKIATYHGGTLNVASIPGKGSTFCVSLPKHSQDNSLKKEIALNFPN